MPYLVAVEVHELASLLSIVVKVVQKNNKFKFIF